MVEITKTVYAGSREKWRKWLEKNHDRVDEIWLLYAKKASGKKRVGGKCPNCGKNVGFEVYKKENAKG